MVLTSFFPNTLNIFLTDSCNLDCRYCFVERRKNPKAISVSRLKHAVHAFLGLPGRRKFIAFTGGEPLLEFKKIKELCCASQERRKKSKKQEIVWVAITNGTLFRKEHLDFFKKFGVILKTSIDGRPRVHDENRPFLLKTRVSSHQKVSYFLKSLRDHDAGGPKVCASMVFSPSSAKTFLENIKSIQALRVHYIDFYPDISATYSDEDLKNIGVALSEFADFYISLFKKRTRCGLFKNSLLENFIKGTDLYKPAICRKIHADRRGRFYFCDKVFALPESKRKKYEIGNSETGLDNHKREILLRQKRREIAAAAGTDCESCPYLKYCFCPVGHYIYCMNRGLNYKEYFAQFCRLSQEMIKAFLKIKHTLAANLLFAEIYK